MAKLKTTLVVGSTLQFYETEKFALPSLKLLRALEFLENENEIDYSS
jgi:hypothetical protein